MSDEAKEAKKQKEQPTIAVVGPCASGKSLLVKHLQKLGYNAREVNQEHSYVPTMWRRSSEPDLLIYLDVSQETASERRSAEANATWWEALNERLEHALQHADLRVDTDELTPNEVQNAVLSFLKHQAR